MHESLRFAIRRECISLTSHHTMLQSSSIEEHLAESGILSPFHFHQACHGTIAPLHRLAVVLKQPGTSCRFGRSARQSHGCHNHRRQNLLHCQSTSQEGCFWNTSTTLRGRWLDSNTRQSAGLPPSHNSCGRRVRSHWFVEDRQKSPLFMERTFGNLAEKK